MKKPKTYIRNRWRWLAQNGIADWTEADTIAVMERYAADISAHVRKTLIGTGGSKGKKKSE